MLLYIALFIVTSVMANILPITVVNRLRSFMGQNVPENDENDSNDTPKEDESYNPTPIDIVVTRVMLTKGKRLPPGIVDVIFDFAEYWAHSSNEIDYMAEHNGPLRVHGSSPAENKFLIRSFPVGLTGIQGEKDLAEVLAYDTNEAKPRPLGKEHDAAYFAKLADYPTPTLMRPVRKVVFSMRSHDQGWGGERENRQTYQGSWTWFEAGLERFDADQICDSQCTYDVRYKSPASQASPLPVCSLRPLYPSIVPASSDDDDSDEESEVGYNKRMDDGSDHGENDDEEGNGEEGNGEEGNGGEGNGGEGNGGEGNGGEGNGEEGGDKDEPRFKYSHPVFSQPKWEIHRNKTAYRKWQDHQVTWSYLDDIKPESEEARKLDEEQGRGRETGDGWFVRDLKLGDVVTVWAKARFPAWVNEIERVKVDVYWAV
ncbi:hypothetical protein ACJ41O_008926 [Fusarium nematophilum]